MDFNQPLGGNDMPRFAGPTTMMRLPAQDTAEGLDACFWHFTQKRYAVWAAPNQS